MHELFGLSWGEWSAIATIISGIFGVIITLLAKALGKLARIEKRNAEVEERNYEMSERQIEMNQRMIDSNDRFNETVANQHKDFMDKVVKQDNRIDQVVTEVDDHENRISKLEKYRLKGANK